MSTPPLTPGEFAARVGRRTSTIVQAARSGRLPSIRTADGLRIPASALAQPERIPDDPIDVDRA